MSFQSSVTQGVLDRRFLLLLVAGPALFIVLVYTGTSSLVRGVAVAAMFVGFLLLGLVNEAYFRRHATSSGPGGEPVLPRSFHILRVLLMAVFFGLAMKIGAEQTWREAGAGGLMFGGSWAFIELFRFWWRERAPSDEASGRSRGQQ